MAATNGMYAEERAEVEVEVLSTAVDSARGHGQMHASQQSEQSDHLGSSSSWGFSPSTGNRPSNPQSNPSFYQRIFNLHSSFRQVADTAAAMAMSRMEEAEQREVRAGQPDKTDKTVGSALDQPAAAERRTLDLALCQGKTFISMIASVAAVLGPSTDDSGVDWKFASQGLLTVSEKHARKETWTKKTQLNPAGLDLIFNASREFVGSHNAEHDASFERATYINGAQHVLRGLPRDLEPGEAAMLHRAMPESLGSAPPPPVAGGIDGHHQQQQQQGGTAGDTGNQNAVHVLVLFCMCWLYAIGAWIVPRITAFGARVIQAEQRHQCLPRLWLAASSVFPTVIEAVGWLRACWPVQALLTMLGYAAAGVRGALQEFGEGNMAAPGGAATKRKGAARGRK
jgi:hypothetical protein